MNKPNNRKDWLRLLQSLEAKYLLGMCFSGLVLVGLILIFTVSWRYSQVNISPALYIVAILSVLALVIPGLLIHRSIVRRLRTIIEMTRRVAEGDLSERVDIEVFDEIGELAATFNDMTSRMEGTIREIRKNQDFNEDILNSIEHGIVVIDRDFCVVTANKSYFGDKFSLNEIIGKHCYDLHRHTFDCRETCPAGITFREGKSARDVHNHLGGDGRENVVEVFSSALRDEQGEVSMVILVSKDITHRLEMERKLLRSDKMALVGQMASGLAHEIKNPIAGISAAIQIISQKLDKRDPDREIFDEIQRQISRMKRTLSDLLSYAKPRKPRLIDCDINGLIRRSAALMEPQAKSQNIEVALDLTEGLPHTRIDPDMVQQVLLNLCLNAIQAQVNGGRILIQTSTQNGSREFVKVTLRDEGPGIKPDVQEKIFDPFFTTKHTGTGLGLPICDQIIADHKGVLEIDSEPERGTTCKISLPVE